MPQKWVWTTWGGESAGWTRQPRRVQPAGGSPNPVAPTHG